MSLQSPLLFSITEACVTYNRLIHLYNITQRGEAHEEVLKQREEEREKCVCQGESERPADWD